VTTPCNNQNSGVPIYVPSLRTDILGGGAVLRATLGHHERRILYRFRKFVGTRPSSLDGKGFWTCSEGSQLTDLLLHLFKLSLHTVEKQIPVCVPLPPYRVSLLPFTASTSTDHLCQTVALPADRHEAWSIRSMLDCSSTLQTARTIESRSEKFTCPVGKASEK